LCPPVLIGSYSHAAAAAQSINTRHRLQGIT